MQSGAISIVAACVITTVTSTLVQGYVLQPEKNREAIQAMRSEIDINNTTLASVSKSVDEQREEVKKLSSAVARQSVIFEKLVTNKEIDLIVDREGALILTATN